MSEKTKVRSKIGCAPIPFATGRIPTKLPVISGAADDGNVRIWLPKDIARMTPLSTTVSALDRRFSLDQVGFGPLHARKSSSILSAGKLAGHFVKGHLKSALSVDVSLGDLETVKRMSAVPKGGLWLRTDNNRLRTRAKSADNVHYDAWNSAVSPVFDEESNPMGLSRYTPLPAIGCLTKEETKEVGVWESEDSDINRPEVDTNVGSSLDNYMWNSESANLEKPKLPPLRPIVRSRTFTIISAALGSNHEDEDKNEDEVDDMSNWEDERSDSQMSEDDDMDPDQEAQDDVNVEEEETDENRVERDTLLCLSIRLPNGDELQKYFDLEDTLESVMNFALHRYIETALTEVEELPQYQLVTDEDTPRVFTEFGQTLCELQIPTRALFYLQPSEGST